MYIYIYMYVYIYIYMYVYIYVIYIYTHTPVIQSSSQKHLVKVYKELGLESLKSRRWFRCLSCFYKIKTFGLPSYLSSLILSIVHSYNPWESEDVVTYHCRTDIFKYSFFPWTIPELNLS